MNSPFKFLDAYTLQDKEVFFGRDQETDALYDMVYKSPLMLLYGMSGTGKTSLIQCGLASKFSGPDWYPIWIRRQSNINESLHFALIKATKGGNQESLRDSISYLFRYYLRPVYLIFDQFEELFVLGTTEEQEKFMEDIQDLLVSELPVKILFVMREEYLGHLYHFEKLVPTLFDHRLRVEPMNQKKVKEVLRSSFQKFNVLLEGNDEDRLEEIIQNISGNRSLIQLPYLQVYLDKLYREDYSRTYGEKEREENEFPTLELTEEEIKTFGQIDDVLERFLEEQEKQIQHQINETQPDLPENTVNQIINQFVTEDGTKKPVYLSRNEDEILFEPKIYEALPNIPKSTIKNIILSLEKSRLLRFSDNSIELAHDTLGAVIDQKRTEEQRQLNNILRQIKVAYNAFPRTKEFLTRNQLNVFEPYLPKLQFDLSSSMKKFIKDSLTDVEQKENAERIRVENEKQVLEEKLQAEKEAKAAKDAQLEAAKKAARRQRLFTSIIAGVAILAIGALFWAVQQRNKAVSAEENLQLSFDTLQKVQAERLLADSIKDEAIYAQKKTNFERYFNEGQFLIENGDYDGAIQQLQFALNFDSTKLDTINLLVDQAEKKAGISNRYRDLMDNGNSALDEDRLLVAIQSFRSAFSLGVDRDRKTRAQTQIDKVVVKMEPRFKKGVDNANIFKEAGSCKRAMESIRKIEAFKAYLTQMEIQSEIETIKKIRSECRDQ